MTDTPVRRAPFSANPAVGPRGQRTQQRILDAALDVFAEHGYDRSTLDAMAKVAGCSRVTIYQYFESKEDLFRHLAGRVARALQAAIDALGPVTPDAAGRDALRTWVAAYGDVHEQYGPVFRVFSAAAASDPVLEGGASAVTQRHVRAFRAQVVGPVATPNALVRLLLGATNEALTLGAVFRLAAPDAYARDRIEAAVADVVHRALFGVDLDVNVAPAGPPPPRLRIGPELGAVFDQVAALREEATQPDRRALAALLAVGDEVVTERGYRGTRVDDVVDAAGVSRGIFYRYFDNIEDFVRVIAVRSVTDVSSVVGELPDVVLQEWLPRYQAAHTEKGALARIWGETLGPELQSTRAAVLDWGRRRMVRLLADRGWGDVELDAFVLLAFVEAYGSVRRTSAEADAALQIVETAFLPH